MVTVHVETGFKTVVTRANRILENDSPGRSCVLHTGRDDRVGRFAREVDVCRAVVDQPGAL